MKTIQSIIVIFLLVSTSNSCKQNGKPVDFDYGHVTDNVYYNNYFSLKMKVPNKWVVQSEDQKKEFMKTGFDIVTEGNDHLREAAKASEINTANLFAAFQNEIGTTVEFNPSLLIIAENVSMFPEINTGADYLSNTKKILEGVNIAYEFLSEDFNLQTIDGLDFYTMDTKIEISSSEVIYQSYFVSLINGFSFSIAITYATEEEKNVLLDAVHSLKNI